MIRRWLHRDDDTGSTDVLEQAERQAEHLAERGHRVADDLQARLRRNHFAELMRLTMGEPT